MENKTENRPSVVVIGGGITGLSAAWELQKSQGALDITVLEQSSRWGGKVITDTLAGPNGGQFIIDAGPESFITRKPELWELVHELGIEEDIVDPGSETRDMFILDQGRPVAVPLAPLKFILSPLMTARGKLRLLAEPFMPAKRDEGDESLAEFADRRLGREARQKFIGPILAGIYNTDPEKQSILTTSPIMREMEKEAGSLFKAAFRRMLAARKQNREGKLKRPRFITFQNGAQRVIDVLVEKLDADLRLNAAVESVEIEGGRYHLALSDGNQMAADAVLIAAPANAASKMLRGSVPAASEELAAIRHENIGTISLAYREEDMPPGLEINGLMIPRREKRSIDAITFTSRKMPSRAPSGFVLLRVFFGGGAPSVAELDDEALVGTVRKELEDLLGITASPVITGAQRWLKSFPQADVGHLDRVRVIHDLLPPGIYVTGSSYYGIGVPDCIRQGKEAAHKAIDFLSPQNAR